MGGSLEDLRRLEKDPVVGYAGVIQHGVIGQGLNDYDAIFSILKGAGFDGWVSIEDGLNGMLELRQSADFLRQKLNQYFSKPRKIEGGGRRDAFDRRLRFSGHHLFGPPFSRSRTAFQTSASGKRA